MYYSCIMLQLSKNKVFQQFRFVFSDFWIHFKEPWWLGPNFKFKSSKIKNQIKGSNLEFGNFNLEFFQKMGIFKMSNNLPIGFQIWDFSFEI